MREIKFRGKTCSKDSRWIYGYLVHNGQFWYIQEGIVSHGVEEASIGQFTGLFDREGKEIWEGDIVKWFINCNEVLGSVIYDERCASFGIGNTTNDWFCGEYEVIGNIYEHPHLLNREEKI